MFWRDIFWRARSGFIVLGMTMTLLCIGARASASEPVSAEATKYFNRGLAAVEMATVPADYDGAIEEFMKAQALAPGWPDVYYNLGVVQEKAGKFKEAADSLNRFLQLAPNAPDAQSIRNLITRLEFKAEQIITDEVALDIFGSLGNSSLWQLKGSTPKDLPDFRGMQISRRDGRQIVINYASSGYDFRLETLRATPQGKSLTFDTVYYLCSDRSRHEDGCPDWSSYRLEIISKRNVKMFRQRVVAEIKPYTDTIVSNHTYEFVRK